MESQSVIQIHLGILLFYLTDRTLFTSQTSSFVITSTDLVVTVSFDLLFAESGLFAARRDSLCLSSSVTPRLLHQHA